MRASFAILAGSAFLLLAVSLVLGLALAGGAGATGNQTLYPRHVVVAVCTMLFACFVHVLGFTYFVVCARMACDAVATAGLPHEAYLRINDLKRSAIRWLLLGVLTLLAAGVTGALAAPPASIHPNWHLALAIVALAANGVAFLLEFHLINRNTVLMEDAYSAIPPRGAA